MANPKLTYSFKGLESLWYCDCCDHLSLELADGTEIVFTDLNADRPQIERFVRVYMKHDASPQLKLDVGLHLEKEETDRLLAGEN